jgi:hypothetical protein
MPIYFLAGVLGDEYDGSFKLVVDSLPFWGLLYWIPDQALTVLNDGKRIQGQFPLSVAIGIAVCTLADRMLYWRNKKHASKS